MNNIVAVAIFVLWVIITFFYINRILNKSNELNKEQTLSDSTNEGFKTGTIIAVLFFVFPILIISIYYNFNW